MATLNPQSLVTLWQIEQYGSFSATAKATGWSQPAISQQIKKLEAQCGSTLVQRTSHGVELTATGSMLARHGEAIADRLERAAREVEDYRHHRFDHLHLVAPPSICSTIAARTVVKLSMFTDIELSLIQMEPPEAIGLISQGKADTAAVFRYSSIPNFLHIGDDLTFHSLGYDPMRLLVRRSSGIAKRFEETGEPVPLSAAKDEHWIAGCPTCRANLVKLAARAGFKPDIRHCTDDYWATQNLVEVGMGRLAGTGARYAYQLAGRSGGLSHCRRFCGARGRHRDSCRRPSPRAWFIARGARAHVTQIFECQVVAQR